ncbi:MAG: Uma2 family endonuclease [Myxococcota bacterium]
MTATAEDRYSSPERWPEDGIVCLRGATWADYERMLEVRGDCAGPRISYLDGVIEFMSPSQPHEGIKGVIGRLVEAFCFFHDIEFSTYGSWTLKKAKAEAGVEPDECYVFGTEKATRPHLAIEVIWTWGGLRKLEIYRRLGVQEVWVWDKGQLEAHVLDGDTYRLAVSSSVLPGIDLAQLVSHLDHPTTSQAVRAYRAELEA